MLAQNIANANTPRYRPHDLKPFAATLGGVNATAPARTQPNHMAGLAGAGQQIEAEPRPAARAPDGNAVALDEQLVKLADTETTHALVTTIYKRYLGMFGMALGRHRARQRGRPTWISTRHSGSRRAAWMRRPRGCG